jgi:hypothetical protein
MSGIILIAQNLNCHVRCASYADIFKAIAALQRTRRSPCVRSSLYYAGSRNAGFMPRGSGMRNVLSIIETRA